MKPAAIMSRMCAQPWSCSRLGCCQRHGLGLVTLVQDCLPASTIPVYRGFSILNVLVVTDLSGRFADEIHSW